MRRAVQADFTDIAYFLCTGDEEASIWRARSKGGDGVSEVLSVAQCYAADRLLAECQEKNAGQTGSYALMQRAGAAIARAAQNMRTAGPVFVVCGHGGNGGDGYVAARILRAAGRPVYVLSLTDVSALEGDAQTAQQSWGGAVHIVADGALSFAALHKGYAGGGLLIDALVGAGMTGALRPPFARAVEAINRFGQRGKILSVDIPSGINGDKGAVPATYVQADLTVTFFRKNPAHVLYPAAYACGQVVVEDMGLKPDHLTRIVGADGARARENSPALWPGLPPRSAPDTHKHKRGRLLVMCGGALNTGAARLAARAGLRAGAGLVTLVAKPEAALVCAHHETAIMIAVRDGETDLAAVLDKGRTTACVIGPAGGVGRAMRDDVTLLAEAEMGLVVDADALTSFADDPAALFALMHGRCVLTPHEGEFARLFPDLADQDVCKIDRVRGAAKRAGCVVLLKGPDTVIADWHGRVIINTNAPPDLATAGSGDVLAGIIGALLSSGAPALEAAAAGAWMHGAAGALCGPGLIAEDLPGALPEVLLSLNRADKI